MKAKDIIKLAQGMASGAAKGFKQMPKPATAEGGMPSSYSGLPMRAGVSNQSGGTLGVGPNAYYGDRWKQGPATQKMTTKGQVQDRLKAMK